VVPKDSPIKSVADLKGKKVALNKGSNVHYLLVKLLEKARPQAQRHPARLPAAGRCARRLRKRSVDAWVIWDPFTAAAEKPSARACWPTARAWSTTTSSTWPSAASSPKPQGDPAPCSTTRWSVGVWLKANLKKAAELIAPLQGLPVDVVELSLRRYELGVKPVPASVIADQQKLADTFFELKLIPKAGRRQRRRLQTGALSLS
jgi:sulfonate transport system substrate-binding protein